MNPALRNNDFPAGVNSVKHPSGITYWPEIDAVDQAGRRLATGPMPKLTAQHSTEVEEWFATHCNASKDLAQEARKYIPGGVQHNLAFNKPFPLDIVRAQGAHLWDADGNRYIDFIQAGGPTLLGSNFEPVRDKVAGLLHECGPVTGLFHKYELKLARLIHDFMPNIELFRMLGSGTESVMAAIRAARTFTGLAQIVKVGGGYHGWSDQVVYGMRLPGTGLLDAAGIPEGALSNTTEVWPNDVDALRKVLQANRERGGTAAVIVEPFGPESGVRPVRLDYNEQVSGLCKEYGALLIFDEVVTGFRAGLGGAQAFFGLKPDLTIFGKCVAGGYPAAGGVGGRVDVMSVFAAGIGGTGRRAMVGGTLSANPLSSAAGYWSLLEIERTRAPEAAGRAGDRLSAGLQRLIDKFKLPFVTYNLGAIVHLHTTGILQLDLREKGAKEQVAPRKEGLEDFGAAFTAAGIITLAGSRLYTSLADTDEVVDDALNRFEQVFRGVEGAAA
ncbi:MULTISPECIES: aspartate aminotransferase family protein [Paraburkholderia]|uniref:aspartate aminotransferase family protein n=1 Tax=Paraburkholderia TaxID=1822464 RepID=UPI00225A3E3F|nr:MULTISPECIES: aminotransferase class III-fold pyridoxal phosphate-dependent enzyme [Paraburkholderia]MCX4160923.1 aminotransferase class III-fold pyridoxal phosphate-dependent enzyme [Paraburkholderia megapolitana]MDN7156419.1 aminotransferase class III-fold pyridoxal phosphate-dependent enzyme [Paraburkholderia sp. CHISQ3]MDQ6493464.1 aminotransferase class III-fold pyridoxal phosphate-dependent enzyme [Paraburkholderia megapolitana]